VSIPAGNAVNEEIGRRGAPNSGRSPLNARRWGCRRPLPNSPRLVNEQSGTRWGTQLLFSFFRDQATGRECVSMSVAGRTAETPIPLAAPSAPISRPPAHVCKRHDLDIGLPFAVDDEVRESTQRHPTHKGDTFAWRMRPPISGFPAISAMVRCTSSQSSRPNPSHSCSYHSIASTSSTSAS
jgi:hypothetical protein